ncbi:hypothetical protein ScPMuIL_013092 [Solemya velum]
MSSRWSVKRDNLGVGDTSGDCGDCSSKRIADLKRWPFKCNSSNVDWISLNGSTGSSSYYFSDFITTSSTAETICANAGGTLVIIETHEENQMIWNHVMGLPWKQYLIGLTVDHYTGIASWLTNPGVQAGYVNWLEDEPNPELVVERCVEMKKRNGKWNDVSCDRKMPCICEKSDCIGEGWVALNKTISPSCYYLSRISVTFTVANVICAIQGGNLVIIESHEENQKVWNYAMNVKNPLVYIGLEVDHCTGIASWSTSPGVQAQYINWDDNEPNNGDHDGRPNTPCVQMISNGQWNYIRCAAKTFFICEKSLYPTTTKSESTTTNGQGDVTYDPNTTVSELTTANGQGNVTYVVMMAVLAAVCFTLVVVVIVLIVICRRHRKQDEVAQHDNISGVEMAETPAIQYVIELLPRPTMPIHTHRQNRPY